MRQTVIILSFVVLFVIAISYRLYQRVEHKAEEKTYASGGQTKNITKEIDFRSPGEDLYKYNSANESSSTASKPTSLPVLANKSTASVNSTALGINEKIPPTLPTSSDTVNEPNSLAATIPPQILILPNSKIVSANDNKANISSQEKLTNNNLPTQSTIIPHQDNQANNYQLSNQTIVKPNQSAIPNQPAYFPSHSANNASKSELEAPLAPSSEVFYSKVESVSIEKLGATWRPSCPVSVDELRLLKVSYWDFSLHARIGEIIVHYKMVDNIKNALHDLWQIKFQINRMRTLDAYVRHEDFISDGRVRMDNEVPDYINNTAAFLCRESIVKKNYWSEHSYGLAIDINPVQNPFVTRNKVWPINGRQNLNRATPAIGKIDTNSAVIKIMQNHGFKWGGNWSHSRDYMHFSLTGK